MTYAIVWRENEGLSYSGRLELGANGILLSGSGAGRESHRELRYDGLTSLALERRSLARHTSQPTLVLVTRGDDRIAIGSLEGLGALHELAENVAGARGKAAV
jgi:hypothetical protein